jgi:biotin synthase
MKHMDQITRLKPKVLSGESLTKIEALALYDAPLEELCQSANEIREHFCGNVFDICAIMNGKSGTCSEDCNYCAQSVLNHTKTDSYPLRSTDEVLKEAKYHDAHEVMRFSIVTSGKALSDMEIDRVCETIHEIKQETNLTLCVSFGLLDEMKFRRLKAAGVTRIHNNLETSRRFFPSVCTTHSYEDKVRTIQAAQRVGLTVCSGGLMGLGETPEDRIDMAIELRELGIHSIPINLLNPIKGTPYENNHPLSISEMRRIVAVYRFLLPDAFIRLAGGRGLLADQGYTCFASGANAAISGDMLTTTGISVDKDMQMLKELGFRVATFNG